MKIKIYVMYLEEWHVFAHIIAVEVPLTFLPAIFTLSIKRHFLCIPTVTIKPTYELWGGADWAAPLRFNFWVFKMKFCIMKGVQFFLYLLCFDESLKTTVLDKHLKVEKTVESALKSSGGRTQWIARFCLAFDTYNRVCAKNIVLCAQKYEHFSSSHLWIWLLK